MKSTRNLCNCLLFCILLISFFSCGFRKMDYYIFKDIEECEKIFSMNYDNAKFNHYETAENDEHLGALKYDTFFAGEFRSDELNFEIFAYQFDSDESAKSYFENVTGKSSSGLMSNFSHSGGITESQIVVIDSDRAYSIIMPTSEVESVQKMLEDVFSVKLDVSNPHK